METLEQVGYSMDTEIKQKWIDALRSGRYIQGEGQLFTGEETEGKPHMCCLGVLEDICGGDRDYMDKEFPSGLEHQCSPELDSDLEQKLALMNDGEGASRLNKKTFAEIADYIEKNL